MKIQNNKPQFNLALTMRRTTYYIRNQIILARRRVWVSPMTQICKLMCTLRMVM